jgi:hypothetical protein
MNIFSYMYGLMKVPDLSRHPDGNCGISRFPHSPEGGFVNDFNR